MNAILVLAVIHSVDHELAPVPLSCCLGTPGNLVNTLSDNHPLIRQSLWESKFPEEKLQDTLLEKGEEKRGVERRGRKKERNKGERKRGREEGREEKKKERKKMFRYTGKHS